MAKKIVIAAVVLFLVVTTAAFFYIRSQLEPEKLRSHLLGVASGFYTGRIDVASVGISGFRTIEIRGVRLASPDGRQVFLSLDAFAVEIDLWSLLGKEPRVQKLILQKPMIDMIMDGDGKPAILAYVKRGRDGKTGKDEVPKEGDAARSKESVNLAIERIAVVDGLLRYSDPRRSLPFPAEVKDLCIELALSGQNLRIRSISARLPGGLSLEGRGMVKLVSPPVLDGVKIALRGQATELLALAPKVAALSDLQGGIEMDLTADGPVSAIPASSLRLRLAGLKAMVSGLPPLASKEIVVEVSANGKELRLVKVTGDLARIKLSGAGTMALVGDRATDMKVQLAARLQDFVSFLPKKGALDGLDGNLRIELAARGSQGRVNPSARIVGEKIRLSLAAGLNPAIDEFEGLVELQGKTAHLRSLTARVAEGTIKGQGQVSMNGEPARYQLQLRLSGLKPWKTLEPVLAPYAFGKPIEDFILRSATIEIDENQLALRELQAGLGSSKILGDLLLKKEGPAFVHRKSAITVDLDAKDLFAVLAVAPEHRLAGRAQLPAQITGSLTDPVVNGPLKAERLVYSYGEGGLLKSELRDVTARVTYQGLVAKVLDLQAQIFGGSLQGEGQVDLTQTPLTYDFDVKSVRVAASRLVSDLGGSAAEPFAKAVAGSMALVCKGKGAGTELSHLDADGSFSIEGLKIDGIPALKTAAEMLDMPVLAKLEAPSVKTVFKIAQGALAMTLQPGDFSQGMKALGGTIRLGSDSGLKGGFKLELPEGLMRASKKVEAKVKTFLDGNPQAAKLGLTAESVIKGLKLDEKPIFELLVDGSLTAPTLKHNASQLAARILTGLEKDLPNRLESLVKNALEAQARNKVQEEGQALKQKLLDKVDPGAAEALKGLSGGQSGGGLKAVLGGLLGGSSGGNAPAPSATPNAPPAEAPKSNDPLGGLLKKKAGGLLGGLFGGNRAEPAPPSPTPPPTPPASEAATTSTTG